MKTININNQENIKHLLFPDNQPHVQINTEEIQYEETVDVVCSLLSSLDVMHLLQCTNALDNHFCFKQNLYIPYLMGARFDRLMNPGDSVDIRVIANLVNSCGFQKVYLYDVHSDVSSMLINNSISFTNKFLVEKYDRPDATLICPDAGASKKVKNYLEWNKNITNVVYCVKSRNLQTGDLTIKVLQPEQCAGKNCVVIDDLCDAGGTFLGISNQIIPFAPKSMTLMVTHGLFTKGFKTLETQYDLIMTSDSYQRMHPDSSIVKIYKCPMTNNISSKILH